MTDALMTENCARGYHNYQDVWESNDKQLQCAQLRIWKSNLHNGYAVAVLKEEIVSCWSYAEKNLVPHIFCSILAAVSFTEIKTL